METALIKRFFQQEQYSSLDRRFAWFIYRLDGRENAELYLAAGLLCSQVYQGHVCLDLAEFAGKKIVWEDDQGSSHALKPPSLKEWTERLAESATVGTENARTPLVMSEKNADFLYLRRYWNYEVQLAEYIKEKLDRPDRPIDPKLLKKNPEWPEALRTETDERQRLAALTALKRDFCVISGGPGSGKTSTVIKILILLLQQNPDLKIALAAPTGKAAARLKDSVTRAKSAMESKWPELSPIMDKIPESAMTVHRLLGVIGNSPYFRHNGLNPLPCDCVILDEASMADLALMSKLTQALKENARLILIGDKHQLFSVEAGSALGDICALADESADKSPDFLVELKNNYRFKQDQGIGKLSSLIKLGRGKESLDLMLAESSGEVKWRPIPSAKNLKRYLKDRILPCYSDYFRADSPRETFRLFESFMILCAFRNGPYGTENINALLERIMLEEGLIKPGFSRWYKGRPVMILRNNYNFKLFNGDIGICEEDRDNSGLKVRFSVSEDRYRSMFPGGLPEHETAFAITVHKSQGSEFEKIIMILGDRDSPLLNRELLYTGLTRARKRAEIWSGEDVFIQAAARKTGRSSGLKNALRISAAYKIWRK